MKRIGLIELASHNEVLYNYCKVLLEARYEIIVFSNSFNHDQVGIDHDRLQWKLQKEEESDIGFLNRQKSIIADCDLLIFLTIDGDFSFYGSFQSTQKRVLVLHDLIAFLSPHKQFLMRESPFAFLKDAIKLGKYLLTGEKKVRADFINNFDAVALPSQAMQTYHTAKNWKSPPTFVFDFALHQSQKYSPHPDGSRQITIPGVISDKGRDYHLVIAALRQMSFEQKTSLVLLGKPKGSYGKKIISLLEQLKKPNLEVVWYGKFIDQDEFDRILEQTDFLLLPIARHMKYKIFREISGHTCVSGNINDMYRFGIPALVSKNYPLPASVEKMVDRFGSAHELAAKMDHWIRQKEYLKRRAYVTEALKAFTIPVRAKAIAKELEQLFD